MTSIIRADALQNLNTSNIITQTNATTLTIGASGQTISIPSGATLTGTGAGLIWQSVQTTGFTAVAGKAYPCNTTSAAFTVTLPATPSAGDQVQVVDYAGTFDTNKLVIDRNGNKIEGSTINAQLTGEREGVILTYIDSTQGWIATSGINEGTDALEPQTFSVDYLVAAGGGGGGHTQGGGGGAGGYRVGSLTLDLATNYTVTVGGGGGAGLATGTAATNGNNSIFSSITSTGGGAGGSSSTTGSTGGSGGGGAAQAASAGGGNGTVGQGNNGGAGADPNAGGGGGAGEVGNTDGQRHGGDGTASSITGSSVTYAGGGSGGSNNNTTITGGNGGGGDGIGAVNPAGGAGTANTGGGGGGGGSTAGVGNGNGGGGGSGIVIIKYPDTLTISNPGGGLTSSTPAASGGFKVTSFTAGTGNIQFN